MFLVRSTVEFTTWCVNVMVHFLSVRRGTTLTVVFTKAVSQVTNLLAFILPLKVVMIAASEGTPKFAPFINNENRLAWVIGLSVSAILFYVVTLTLERLAKRLSAVGGGAILAQSNTLAIGSNYREEAAGLFGRFCQIVALMIFAAAGLAAMAVLNSTVFIYMSAFIACCYILTGLLTRQRHPSKKGKVGLYIEDNLGQYLKLMASVGFLTTFLIVLYPFVFELPSNVLIAIASIMVVRRVFPTLVSAIVEAHRLTQRRPFVDATLFDNHRLPQLPARRFDTLRELFAGSRREKIVLQQLDTHFNPGGKLKVSWIDPFCNHISAFRIRGAGQGSSKKRFLLKVYPATHLHLQENERHLYTQVRQDKIFAPELIKEFRYGTFQCEVLEYGRGQLLSAREWSRIEPTIQDQIWTVEPSFDLKRAYFQSHMPLQDRLEENLIDRIEIAVDTGPQRQALRDFRKNLGALKEQLAQWPLTLVNPELSPQAVVLSDDGFPLILSWARWRLEPMGSSLLRRIDRLALEKRLSVVRQTRSDIPDDFGVDKLLLARQSALLVRLANSGAYRAALSLIMRDFSEVGERLDDRPNALQVST